MPYPSSVDTGQIQPWALYTGEPSVMTASALTATTAYFVGVTLSAYVVLTGIRTQFTTGGNGNYDLGIYDVNGNLLNNKGAALSSTAVITYTLATPLPLSPGNYWLALWAAVATDFVPARPSTGAGVDIVRKVVAASNLPATMSGATNTTFKPYIMGLLQGGFS